MATEYPAWLNACFVRKVLQSAEKDETIEVSGIMVTAATTKNDNFASEMHRVTVQFSRVRDDQTIREKTSLVVKSVLRGDSFAAKMVEGSGFFETELSMVSVTLPRMIEILKKLSPKPLAARCLHIQYENPTHIVFEDLALGGFRMANRYVGLDLDHCLLAIRNTARFHASSIALKEQDPMAFTKYMIGMVHKDQHPSMVEFFNSAAKTLSDETAKWPELSPRIAEKILKLSSVLYEKGCEAVLYRENDFNVLNHGDLWVNNMLFRYAKRQKPIDHIFVDFQLCYYGSPAVDILHFFGRCLTDEVRLNHRELILREYHNSLTSAMAKLKCHAKVISLKKLKEILEKRAFCEVFTIIAFMTGRIIEESQQIECNEVVNKTAAYRNPAHCRRSYREIMIRLLSSYDKAGLLDV